MICSLVLRDVQNTVETHPFSLHYYTFEESRQVPIGSNITNGRTETRIS